MLTNSNIFISEIVNHQSKIVHISYQNYQKSHPNSNVLILKPNPTHFIAVMPRNWVVQLTQNPIPNRVGRLCPPHYYLPTRIWKPNGISAVYVYHSIDIKMMIFVKSGQSVFVNIRFQCPIFWQGRNQENFLGEAKPKFGHNLPPLLR